MASLAPRNLGRIENNLLGVVRKDAGLAGVGLTAPNLGERTVLLESERHISSGLR